MAEQPKASPPSLSHKRQFTGTGKRKESYVRQVRYIGHTRYVALGKFIPDGWSHVRLSLKKKKPNSITIKIERLLSEKRHASSIEPNPQNQQDT